MTWLDYVTALGFVSLFLLACCAVELIGSRIPGLWQRLDHFFFGTKQYPPGDC